MAVRICAARHWSLHLPLSPMVVLPIRIKHALNAAAQRPHNADAREHRWSAYCRHQDESFHSALPRGSSSAGSRQRLFSIIAKMNFEKMQALSNCHFCSFEPERYQGEAFSGLNHFPELLVIFRTPWASGVFLTVHHFTTRSARLARSRATAATTSRRRNRVTSMLIVAAGFRRELGSRYSAKIAGHPRRRIRS